MCCFEVDDARQLAVVIIQKIPGDKIAVQDELIRSVEIEWRKPFGGGLQMPA